MSSANQYDQRNIQTMEMVYGRGYLSAGGNEEVVKILSSVDVKGKHVLDLGCGLGGAAVVLVGIIGAAKVTGFDVDRQVLDRAAELILEQQLDDRIELVNGQPGPLEFSDDYFDIVYMTAVSCHMDDLGLLFTDIFRVLKPGGCLVGSEWIIRANNESFRKWDNLLRERGLNFYFKHSEAFLGALKAGGFAEYGLIDRTEQFAEYSRQACSRVETELKASLEQNLGVEGYQGFLDWAYKRYESMRDGGMLQCHFKAVKPIG
jgi:ubiquinone/menaquinone biosynthesis C-methylase UbiE